MSEKTNVYYYFFKGLRAEVVKERTSEVNTDLFKQYTQLSAEQELFYVAHRDDYIAGNVSVQEIKSCKLNEPVISDPDVDSFKEFAMNELRIIRGNKEAELCNHTAEERYLALMSQCLRESKVTYSRYCFYTSDEVAEILKEANEAAIACDDDFEEAAQAVNSANSIETIQQIIRDYKGE